MFRSEEVVE